MKLFKKGLAARLESHLANETDPIAIGKGLMMPDPYPYLPFGASAVWTQAERCGRPTLHPFSHDAANPNVTRSVRHQKRRESRGLGGWGTV